jgi:enoyl-CoA hydratase
MTNEPTAQSVQPGAENSAVKGEPTPDVDIRIAGAAAVVTWQRSAALNALTAEMRDALAARMPAFARDPQVYAVITRSACPRAFSAGGDVREIAALGRSDLTQALAVTAREYSLNWLLECFSKPTVSLIDGMVVGSGVGVTLYGTHRVAGEGYTFAMPETMLGLFPDVGVAHTLARLPDSIGMYLGLTGRRIGRADAYALGLVTHCITSARFGEIEAGLMAAEPVDPLLDARHEPPGAAPIDAQRRWISATFSAETLAEVFARLETLARDGGEGGDFAQSVLADLARAAPLSLAVTFRHIREARGLDLRQTLMRDYRLCARFLEGHDFYEGVRALLIDKDRKPRWTPAALADVSSAMVDRYFAPRPSDELVLVTRQEMQAARV